MIFNHYDASYANLQRSLYEEIRQEDAPQGDEFGPVINVASGEISMPDPDEAARGRRQPGRGRELLRAAIAEGAVGTLGAAFVPSLWCLTTSHVIMRIRLATLVG
jgi:hypothetical protein